MTLRRKLWFVPLLLGALGFASQALGEPRTASAIESADAAPRGDTDEVPTCVEASAEARYRNYGYDHIVHLRSRCDVDAYCKVWTDVNPSPVDVRVPPRQEVEVLTFRGSPARQFTPHVDCRFRV